ncbi:hypothetical protein F4678DRAFT_464981 [Xylaria arbuscula]|nr:hypothetical protein F4678DRAFT_464981 [Xylaria arbuscula]
MATNEYISEYKSEALLAKLRAATPSNSVEDCELCQLQNKIVCDHLTAEQYASLKTTKRTLATEADVAKGEDFWPLQPVLAISDYGWEAYTP